MSEGNVAQDEDLARQYREAVEPHLAGEQRLEVVGSVAQDKDPWTKGTMAYEQLFGFAESLYHSMLGRRAHRLPPAFLIALTSGEAHFFDYRRTQSEVEIREEVLVLDRSDIRFIVGEEEVLTLVATEGGYSTYVDLDRKSLDDHGAAEVVAAVSE